MTCPQTGLQFRQPTPFRDHLKHAQLRGINAELLVDCFIYRIQRTGILGKCSQCGASQVQPAILYRVANTGQQAKTLGITLERVRGLSRQFPNRRLNSRFPGMTKGRISDIMRQTCSRYDVSHSRQERNHPALFSFYDILQFNS